VKNVTRSALLLFFFGGLAAAALAVSVVGYGWASAPMSWPTLSIGVFIGLLLRDWFIAWGNAGLVSRLKKTKTKRSARAMLCDHLREVIPAPEGIIFGGDEPREELK
jgi:hypothetical protein